MTFRSLAAVAGLAIATLAGASSAYAAPLGGMDGIADTPNLVTKVHGCHRSCERGPVLGWHRHVGRPAVRSPAGRGPSIPIAAGSAGTASGIAAGSRRRTGGRIPRGHPRQSRRVDP